MLPRSAVRILPRGPRKDAGRVAILRSYTRWCSDSLEFTCWNAEVIMGTFALHCHDREVVGWVATTMGVSGKMIRNLMVECVEARFSAHRAPHPVQWFVDNSSPEIAAKTIDIEVALNLEPRFTPVKSPKATVWLRLSSKPSSEPMPA